MFKRILVVTMMLLVLASLATVSFAAGGSGPADALTPEGAEQTVAAHSALWYRFDYTGNKTTITVTVDDNHASGIRLAIYTPQEIADWQSSNGLAAIGTGSPLQDHDLGWVGRFNMAGTFYAVVRNDTDANVSVRVNVTGDGVRLTAPPTVTAPKAISPAPVSTDQRVSGKLAFTDSAGGNLYTVNGDGTNLQRVSFGIDPQWNHSGTQIAVARQGPVAGIFTLNADGSNESLRYARNEVRAPDWNPDDSQLVFSFQGVTKGGGQSCFGSFCFNVPGDTQWKLGGVNLADNKYFDVRATNHAYTPTWNHYGKTIAFNDLSIGIMQTSVDGDVEPFPFIGDLRITSSAYSPLRLNSPQYSPDGKQIVYMVVQQPSWEIALANADGSNQHLLTRIDPLAFTNPNNASPVWSPDSKQIMFLSNRNGKWEFFVMDVGDPLQGADGSNEHQVLKNITDQIPINFQFEGIRMMSWSK